MAQLTPEARTRLDAFKDVTVKHAHLQAVDVQLSLWVEEHTDATHVLLCGPGGVGKSKALTVVAERFAREEPDRFVVPILSTKVALSCRIVSLLPCHSLSDRKSVFILQKMPWVSNTVPTRFLAGVVGHF